MSASPFWLGAEPLVLASGSSARRLFLEACGIPLEIIKPRVDEKAIAATLLENRASPAEIAIALAHAKAEAVARLNPNRLVLAADQTLDLDGSLFMKPVIVPLPARRSRVCGQGTSSAFGIGAEMR